MNVSGAAVTNVGVIRSANEDCVVAGSWLENRSMDVPYKFNLETSSNALCLVADGMGGHNAGDQASEYVSRELLEKVTPLISQAELWGLLRAMNREIFSISENAKCLTGMGTTVAGLIFAKDHAIWFNVGDSKIFRFRNNYLRQLSIDDTPRESSDMSSSHCITQALGGASKYIEIEPHIGTEPLVPGWRYLICSDGLTDTLSLSMIENALLENDNLAASQLLAQALKGGASDNVSIVVVTVGQNDSCEMEAVK